MKTPDLHDTITILGVLACILLLLSSCKGASIQIVPMPYTDTPPQQCSTQCQTTAPEGETCCQTEGFLCPDDETVSPDCAEYSVP